MACVKIPFKTKREAKTFFCRKKASKHGYVLGKLRFYECPHCQQWHMTSMSKSTTKRLRKRLKDLGIEAGQIWENPNGDTLEIVKPPSTLEEIGRWLIYFRLVKSASK